MSARRPMSLNTYRIIDEAGGIRHPAHANSTHGVALQGIELRRTDAHRLHTGPPSPRAGGYRPGKEGKKTTVRFFDGSKPEYPRP